MNPFDRGGSLRFMFSFYQGMPERLSARKVRLIGVALCREVQDLFPHERCHQSVEIAERFADGLATDDERISGRYEIEDVLLLTPQAHASKLFQAHYCSGYAASDLCKKDPFEAAEDVRHQVDSARNSVLWRAT